MEEVLKVKILKQTKELYSDAFIPITGQNYFQKEQWDTKLPIETLRNNENLFWDFFSISIPRLGFVLKKGWEIGFREN